MITIRERLKNTTSELNAREIYQDVRSEGDFTDFARQYVFDEDSRVARNALWVLTKASNRELSELQCLLHELINLAIKTHDPAVRRLSLHVVERLKMREYDLRTDFLDFCFEHMVAIDEFPGIQTLCMKMAYRMCMFHPELNGELMRTLFAMEMDYYKPAVKSIRNKILSGKLK